MPDAPVSELFNIIKQQNITGLQDAAHDFYNDVMGFVHAIDWSERWLLALGGFHTLVWILALASRRNHDAQMVLLVCILGMVYVAEYLNTFAAARWREFAGQNYFDKRGVFISVMYSAPLLCASMFLLLNALRATSSLLIKVKRKEIRSAQKRKAKEAKAE